MLNNVDSVGTPPEIPYPYPSRCFVFKSLRGTATEKRLAK